MIWRTVASSERLEGARDRRFAVEHVSDQNFGRELFFVELLAQLQRLDVVEKFDDFFVRAVAERAEESRRQKFPAAFAAIEIDVKQIAVSNCTSIHEPRSGMIRKL